MAAKRINEREVTRRVRWQSDIVGPVKHFASISNNEDSFVFAVVPLSRIDVTRV